MTEQSTTPTNTTLQLLAARISANASIVEAAGPESSSASHEVKLARESLRDDIHDLQRLISVPGEFLERHQYYYQQLACLRWLLEFNIFTYVPLKESISYEALAIVANVPVERLRSVVRMTTTDGLFTEPTPGEVAHSRLSASFAENVALRDWATFMTLYSAPTASKFAAATTKWGESSAKNQTAYNITFDTDLPFFAHLAQSQERTASFAGYMRSLGQNEGGSFKHILSGFDWASLGKAHVVDVGGSTGKTSILLAENYPELSFTIQDLPDTIAASGAVLASLEAPIASRIVFEAHDIFKPEPSTIASVADVFFLRKIIHDWPLADAKIILQHLAAALKPGAKILIMDTILPVPGSVSARHEASMRIYDLAMAQSFNSKEREMSDWLELFSGTTPKLRLKDFKKPFGSIMAIMVVELDE